MSHQSKLTFCGATFTHRLLEVGLRVCRSLTCTSIRCSENAGETSTEESSEEDEEEDEESGEGRARASEGQMGGRACLFTSHNIKVTPNRRDILHFCHPCGNK